MIHPTEYDFTALGDGKLYPVASWSKKSQLEGISIVGFLPIVPDFIIKLRSATDNLTPLQEKMHEHQHLAVRRLGLLINPKNKQVETYRSTQEVEILESPDTIDCSEVMLEFILSMSRIW